MHNHNKKFKYEKPNEEGLDQLSAKMACIAWGKQFYKLSRWRKLRHKAFKIYGKKCHCCERLDEHPHVDHIKPRSKFPELALDITNLQILCRECNSSKGNHVFIDYRSKKHKLLAEKVSNKKEPNKKYYKKKKVPYKLIQKKLLSVSGKTQYEFNLNLQNTLSALRTKYPKSVVNEIYEDNKNDIDRKYNGLRYRPRYLNKR